MNYTRWSIVCLVLSIPFVVILWNRRSAQALEVVRFATFDVAMSRGEPGALLRELRSGDCDQAKKIAAIVQRWQPDVLLLEELDDAEEAAAVFAKQYLEVGQNGLRGISYDFKFVRPVNTGEPSGLDLDHDGVVGGPGDAYGYGAFPGQCGMALLSRHAILVDEVRTFRLLPWSAMPGALRPAGWYDDNTWAKLRLSSKSHWDVPMSIGDPKAGGRVVHLLCSHPTPPMFDGPEDRNGCRNHDEIRFWVDYLSPDRAQWIVDDAGRAGGLAAGASFVVLGDLNCDPVDGDARRDALQALLAHPRVQDPAPRSLGGDEQSKRQLGANARQGGDAALDTADFPDGLPDGPGNLRVDYVLPSNTLHVAACGVFWPVPNEPGALWVTASDHRLVWVDVTGL
jgi:endonuclease/exonuclease/phosphatase family metal-dependent hydrolase